MTEFSRLETARRAGVGVDDLDLMTALGLLVPDEDDHFTASDVRKAGFLSSLMSGGLPLDAVAAEVQRGHLSLHFLDDPVFEHFSALSPLTFEDLSERTGVPVESLMVIREAIGSAVPDPTDRVRETELAIVPLIEAQLASGYPLEVVERSLRTMGDNLRTFVLAEADDFRAYVIEPVSDRPGVENPPLPLRPLHAWPSRPSRRSSRSTAPSRCMPGPPTSSQASSTTWPRPACSRGSRHHRRCASSTSPGTPGSRRSAATGRPPSLPDRLRRLVQRTSVQHGGRPVKWLGDGVMFWFRDPGRGVVAALEMADGVVTAGMPPAHVGLHAGPVLFQDGDYYGQTVNMASRIADYARPGEVLVSQAVVDASAGAPIGFTEIGPVELKGVTGSVRLHVARTG